MVMYTTSVPHSFCVQSVLVVKHIRLKSGLVSFRLGQAESLTHFSIEIPVCLTVQAYVGLSGIVQG